MQDSDFIRAMFGRIATKYDFANAVLSGGIDRLWRSHVARCAAESAPSVVVDVACGSGDLWLALRRRLPNAQVVGADFCEPLLHEASRKGCTPLLLADALRLPFAKGSIDSVTVAFGLRNMSSYPGAAREFARVLKIGGRLHVLDFSLPTLPLLRPLYRWYLHAILPRLAGWLTGEPEAYVYLGGSIEQFPSGAAMCALLEFAGFSTARAQPLSLGIATHYTAVK